MLTLLAFFIALGVLIAVHEYGHYRMAVACGVRVLVFSIGFGRTVAQWTPARQKPNQQTKFALGILPLGGYIKMLDEREAPVAPEDRHLAFNTQSLRKRIAIVAAGPLANLLLAMLLYACVNWMGIQETKAILASPPPQSLAAVEGIQGGETVRRIATTSRNAEDALSWEINPSVEALRWALTQSIVRGEDVVLVLDLSTRIVRLPLRRLSHHDPSAQVFQEIGLLAPWSRPEISALVPHAAAAQAGLQQGDLVLKVDGVTIRDSIQIRKLIQLAQTNGQPNAMSWEIQRADHIQTLAVTPAVVQEAGVKIARIGARIGAPPALITVQYGFWDGLQRGVTRVWQVSALTLRMLWKITIGQAALQNLSGPLTMAEYAGKSASLGFLAYLTFLALISASLGVLNLLPIPVLDGGYLMYYLWEAITGNAVSEVWAEKLQRLGMAFLFLMMGAAIFNDLHRQFLKLVD